MLINFWLITYRKHIFELLEFVEADHGILTPPNLSTPIGKLVRRKLIRAWLELNAWIAGYKRANGKNQTVIIFRYDAYASLSHSFQRYEELQGLRAAR
jgi:hypothetical protein